MLRGAVVVLLALGLQGAGQPPGALLHIRVHVAPAGEPAIPVTRYALLISDNPASAPPRRILTDLKGAADVRLRPGNYTVESDQPFRFRGQLYVWTQLVDIVDGRNTTLELTADNAEVERMSAAEAAAAPSVDDAGLLSEWQESVVAIWSPTAHGTGFLIDANGTIATSGTIVGAATTVEVQLDAARKVSGVVLASDETRDVAVIAVDPSVMGTARPVPVACGGPARALAEDGELFALAAPLRGRKMAAAGTIAHVAGPTLETDLALGTGSAGGPVFGPSGDLIGLTTIVEPAGSFGRPEWRVVRVELACGAIAAARAARGSAVMPAPVALPVEPAEAVTNEALTAAARARTGSQSPATMSSSDFDLAFITPVQIHAAEEAAGSQDPGRGGVPTGRRSLVEPLTDFANWSAYVAERPAVLFIRATPKLVESFWTTVGRYAARTQGVALPPFKHVKAGFARMQAFCGDREVPPVHPFKLEQRLSEEEVIYEGFYAFDASALTSGCGEVKLLLYSDKDPYKADSRVVDPAILQRVAADFAAIRAAR